MGQQNVRKYGGLFLALFFCASAHAVCIRSIQYDRSTGTLTILGIGSETFTINKADIIAHFQSETGTLPQRKAATVIWLKQQVLSALPTTINPAGLQMDANTSTGEPLITEISD